MNRDRHTPRRAASASALVLSLALATTACTGDGGQSKPKASPSPSYVTSTGLPYSSPTPGTALGTQDEAVPTKVPEAVHLGSVPAITADQLLVTEDHGAQTLGIHVVDPKTGKTVSSIDSASVNFWAVNFGIVGRHDGLPTVLAAEDWRPRGMRGKADHVLSFYSGDLLHPAEIKLPDDTRLHAQTQSASLTRDGRYFVAWDDAVFGLRVVDLKARKYTGAVRAVGCGPFTWVVGHDVYTPCNDDGKIIRIHVGDDGVPKVAGSRTVFPKGFAGSRNAAWSSASSTAVMVTPEGDVYRVGLADGLPTGTVEPVGRMKLAEGELPGAPVISPDGSRFAVPVTKESATTRVETYDTATFKKRFTISAAEAKVGDLSGIVYAATGSTFYTLSSRQAETGASWLLTGWDPATGKKTGSVTLHTTLAAISGLGNLSAPVEIGAGR
ncbi:hypothetical protein [Streptomyces sp. NPDC047043]|uniref:hypothetical protein n=1 Tax=Streptomyces sp. NPDC047043 TaxID=3154497 RepID=UPI0033E4A4E1